MIIMLPRESLPRPALTPLCVMLSVMGVVAVVALAQPATAGGPQAVATRAVEGLMSKAGRPVRGTQPAIAHVSPRRVIADSDRGPLLIPQAADRQPASRVILSHRDLPPPVQS